MATLYLHIGLHKTATTYLQRAVWPHLKELPYVGKPCPVGSRCSLAGAVSAAHEHSVLFSDESLSGSLRQAYLRGGNWKSNFTAALAELSTRQRAGSAIKVVIGLRTPLAWATSIYKHYLKYGGVDSPEAFFGFSSTATIPLDYLLIAPRLEALCRALELEPFLFFTEEITLQPHALGDDLSRFLGLSDPINFPVAHFNEGLNAFEAHLCRAYNRVAINRGKVGCGYLDRLGRRGFSLSRRISCMVPPPIRGGEFRLPQSIADAVTAHCQEDHRQIIGWMERSKTTHRAINGHDSALPLSKEPVR